MFPFPEYEKIMAEAKAIIKDRDSRGRNAHKDFWSQWPHGSQDCSFECTQRIDRILGAEKVGDMPTLRGDAMDLINYAAFLVMLIDQAEAKPSPRLTHHTDADRASHL